MYVVLRELPCCLCPEILDKRKDLLSDRNNKNDHGKFTVLCETNEINNIMYFPCRRIVQTSPIAEAAASVVQPMA